jgi:filamentous hemagglutinin family protein
MPRLLLVACATILLTTAPAQSGALTDGSLGPQVRLSGDFEVGADLGTQRGANLFHSFERFSIATGESATFTGPDQIRNVISRVTGGAPWRIDGTLRSNIPDADFYFINPAGVLFGPNARLDVQGSFQVSTADELRFADGATFSASEPAASSLSVARPEAFGFLGGAPAHIGLDRGALFVASGETLALIGGPIFVLGGPGFFDGVIGGVDNRTLLIALGPHTQYRFRTDRVLGDRFANILLFRQASVGTLNAGTVRVRAADILMINSDILNVQLLNPDPSIASIVISARRLEMSDGSEVVGDARCFAGLACQPERGTAIRIDVEDLVISDAGARIISRGRDGADAGEISITANKVEISGGSIQSSSRDGGAAGRIVITGPRSLVLQDARISTDSQRAGGGEIRLRVSDLIDLQDSEVTTSVAGGTDPTAGNIVIDPEVLVIDGSRINADAPAGFGGNVTIVADNILVPGGSFEALVAQGDISATGGDPTRSGTVVVDAPDVDLASDLVLLEAPLLDAAAQLRERCAARRDVGASSFTGSGRGGLPPSPDAPLPGTYPDPAAETPPRAGQSQRPAIFAVADCANVR